MAETSPIILWFRRDLRLSDHPALAAAGATARTVVPVFLLDEVVERHGAAPKWRLGLGVERFADSLAGVGARLILRRGEALASRRRLVRETGAGAVWWTRLYDPDSRRRDEAVKAGLKADGLDARSFPGHLIFEPWEVQTGAGGFYKVYTPFWRAVRGRDVGSAEAAPARLAGPRIWPQGHSFAAWDMGAAMDRGAAVVSAYLHVGEEAAQRRLGAFVAHRIEEYAEARDAIAADGTSGLSENLTYGEISPRVCWHAGLRARDEGRRGAETFLRELAWREFAYHLVHHTPHIVESNWREEWDRFPWQTDAGRSEVRAWLRGRTGVELVDAGMREMYVTGRMHNRVRMIAASYLSKHLLTDWRLGQKWFEDCLVDWDPAANAMGWQWTAGSGPDAAPYFRVFNPDTQAERFDPDGAYRRRWLAEGRPRPTKTALSYFEAIPRHWGMSPDEPYPAPVVALDVGRGRALEAYTHFKG